MQKKLFAAAALVLIAAILFVRCHAAKDKASDASASPPQESKTAQNETLPTAAPTQVPSPETTEKPQAKPTQVPTEESTKETTPMKSSTNRTKLVTQAPAQAATDTATAKAGSAGQPKSTAQPMAVPQPAQDTTTATPAPSAAASAPTPTPTPTPAIPTPVPTQSPTVPAETPTPDYHFTQEIVDEAIKCPDIGWKVSHDASMNNEAEKNACAIYYLVLVSKLEPETAHSKTGELCSTAAVRKIETLLSGGNEPFASPGCFWGHAVVAASMTLAQETPVVYDLLVKDGYKERMDWFMKAMAIAGNWGYNDANDYRTGFDLYGNFGKAYNPNFRNSYLSVVLSASQYFEKQGISLDSIYTNFDYDTYITQFQAYNFSNILSVWQTDGIKDLMENGGTQDFGPNSHDRSNGSIGDGKGVKIPSRYTTIEESEYLPLGTVLEAKDKEKLFLNLVNFTYSKTVDSGNRENNCYILSGKASPYEGQFGMMAEFDASDSQGFRSKATYCYDSWEILVPVYANMKLLDGWVSSSQTMQSADHRILVGNEDLLFKLENGYHGRSLGTYVDENEYFLAQRGHRFIKDIWNNYHRQLGIDTTTEADPNKKDLTPIPDAEKQDHAADAFEAVRIENSAFPQSSFLMLNQAGTLYEKGKISFDIVIGDDVNEGEFNCVVMPGQKADSLGWAQASMQIQFLNGYINIRNGGSYTNTRMRIGANYQYHVEVQFDTTASRYTTTIRQTYPEPEGNASRVYEYTASDYEFRNKITGVDSLSAVKSTEQSVLWVQNVSLTDAVIAVPTMQTVYYESDFDDSAAWQKYLSINCEADNKVEWTQDGNNGFITMSYDSTEKNCYFQAQFNGMDLNQYLVVDVALRTAGQVPRGFVEYVYGPGSKDKANLFVFNTTNTDNAVKLDHSNIEIARISADAWTNFRFRLNPQTGEITAYRKDGDNYTEVANAKGPASTKATQYVRFYLWRWPGKENTTLQVDDLKIYGEPLEAEQKVIQNEPQPIAAIQEVKSVDEENVAIATPETAAGNS